MRRRALLSASMPKHSGGGGGGDIDVVIPEGMFPLYFEHDYSENEGFPWTTYYKDITPEILNKYHTMTDIMVAYGAVGDFGEYFLSLERCTELGVEIYVDGHAMLSVICYIPDYDEISWDIGAGFASWSSESLWWEI